MKRIHFDKKGPVYKHYFFWEPWGCVGCLGRGLIFIGLLFVLLYLLSQLRGCSDSSLDNVSDSELPENLAPVRQQPVPPISDDDVIDEEGRRIVSNRLNVLFSAEVGATGMNEWTGKFKELYPGDEYAVLFSDSITKLMALQVPPGERSALKTRLPEQIPDIPFMVFEEEVMESGGEGSDPFLEDSSKAWYFGPIQAAQAWERSTGGSGVVIAVVDSYFDLDSPEFSDIEIVGPYNVSSGGSDVSLPADFDPSHPDPVLCHGTMVAATAVGALGNAHGSAGIAPECSLMPVSLGRRFGCFAMLQGLLYAINKGASIVNISAGLSFAEDLQGFGVDRQIELSRTSFLGQEEVWKYVFDMADKFYVTIVWAAGNENIFTAIDASKRGSNTIKVSAVDKNLKKADFSNFGNFPSLGIYESTVSAPGVGIYGEVPQSDDGMMVDGTSFAAPIVAGAVGLMKSIDPTLSTQEIAGILRATGRPVGRNSTIGPVIQIRAALDSIDRTLVPFSTIMECYAGQTDYPVSFPTTFLYSFPTSEDYDPTSLMPLLRIELEFTGRGEGNIIYKSNLNPGNVWRAPFTMSFDTAERRLRLRQATPALPTDSALVGISSADLFVSSFPDGCAIVENFVSESLPSEGSFLIKKAQTDGD